MISLVASQIDTDSKGKCYDCQAGYCQYTGVEFYGARLDEYGCLHKAECSIAKTFLSEIYPQCSQGEWPEIGGTWGQMNELVDMVDYTRNAIKAIRESRK